MKWIVEWHVGNVIHLRHRNVRRKENYTASSLDEAVAKAKEVELLGFDVIGIFKAE